MSDALSSPDFGQLDGYSRFAVPLVLERFPGWQEHMAFSRPEGCERAFVEFELAAPSPAIEKGLWLSTADQEITVGLHTHHSHFTDYENPVDSTHIQEALDYVQDLLDERSGIVSWYVGERFVCSRSRDIKEAFPPAPLISGVTRTTLRTWRGTYDRDAEATINTWFKRTLSG